MFQKKHPPNKFNEGGRPQNQYRYIVSASPARDHDVSLNHFHGTLFYNEKGSVEASKFRFILLDSPNWSHWEVGYYDTEHFYIEFEGPDRVDKLNVNIR